MRVPVASLSRKLLSVFFAAALTLGLLPAAAFAAENEVVSSDDVIVSEVQAEEAEDESVEAGAPAGAIINQEMFLDSVVAQAESTRTFFLAQTLESARGIPMVSAKLPIDKGGSIDDVEPEQGDGEDGTEEGGEGSDESDPGSGGVAVESTVVGSFTSDGLTYAIEPGGESVAVVAANYAKLPSDQASENILVIPSAVSFDGADAYSVTRIADGAFSGLTKEAAGASAGIEGTSDSFDGRARALDPSVEGEGAEGAEELEGSEGQESFVGIVALGIPASVSSIEDGAFSGSDTLQYLVVSDDNPTYASFDGALYSADLATLRLIPEGRVGAVRIAPNATDVDPEVFSHCPFVDAVVADADSAAYQLLDGLDGINLTWRIEDVAESRPPEVLELTGEHLREYTSVDSRATYAGGPYYESVYSFVANSSWESQFYNGAHTNFLTHSANANGHAYGRFAGDEIVVMGGSDGIQWMLLRRINDGNVTDLNYGGWASTEIGKYITQKLYWDAALTNPIAVGSYSRDVDAYLGWGYTRYRICYGNNGGTGSCVPADNRTMNDNVVLATVSGGISRHGYTLTGWKIGSSVYSPGQTVNVGALARAAASAPNLESADLWVEAQWTPNTYAVSFNANGGSGGQSANVTATYDAAMPTISSIKPTRAGYTFGGWYDTSASSGGTQYYTASGAGARTWNKTAATTLYARWSPVAYTIAYDEGGGSFSGKTGSYNIETADLTLPTSGTRTGYTFAGWEVSGASGAEIAGNGTTNVTIKRGTYGDLIARAKWTLNAYHLSWDVSHGTHANRTEDFTVEDCPIAMGEATPYDGYAFTGWSGERLSGYPSSFTLDATFLEGKADGATLSFTASFSANPYTAYLHANDETSTVVEHAVTYDAAVADAEVPKRYGYAFSGYWTKNADGSKAELYFDADGAYVKDAVWKGLSDIELYACWTLMGDLEVPISSPSSVSFMVDRATGQACSSDGSSSSYGLIRSSMPEEVPVASVALEALRGPDGTSVPEKLLGKGNLEECAMEVVFSPGASASRTALLRFASAAGSAKDQTLWEFPSTDRPLIPSASSVASGTAGDDIVTDDLGNLARVGELSLSYALKTLSGFDVYEVPLADASEDAARIVFTVDLTGVAQERF